MHAHHNEAGFMHAVRGHVARPHLSSSPRWVPTNRMLGTLLIVIMLVIAFWRSSNKMHELLSRVHFISFLAKHARHGCVGV